MFENASVRSNNPAANKPISNVRENFTPRFEQNEVSMCGTVESWSANGDTSFGKEVLSVMLRVPRLSGTVDRVPVCIPNETADLFKITLRPGDPLMVSGQVRTHFDSEGHQHTEVFAYMAANTAIVKNNTNCVRLTGEIAKQPVYRVTPFGRQITDLILRVPYSDPTYRGVAHVPVVFWGNLAKVMETYRVKETISIFGRFQSREYEKLTNSGDLEHKTAFEVSVHHFTPIERNLINNRGIF